MASAFGSAHNFTIGGNARLLNVGTIQNNYGGTYGLDNLRPFVSFDALFDSSAQDPQRRVHPGTRESVLNKMRDWVNNPNLSQPILWLYGPAGAGKSAIAQTLSRSYDRETLAATFFFFRSDTSRNNGNLLFPTLAWQLAKSVPGARDHIANALNNDPDIPRKAVEDQFEHLISRPLQSMAAAAAALRAQQLMPVVLIDGIDECLDEGVQQRFLDVLGQVATDSSTCLRVLISSRPEAHIQDTMDRFKSSMVEIDLASVDDAYRDVEKYLRDKFRDIALKQGVDERTWPSDHAIEILTSKSSGQFIYASTVIKFISDRDYSARSQLDIVLGLKPNDHESPFAELDALYLEILRRQPHQGFVKEFLVVLVFRTMTILEGDDALLMNLDYEGLCRNLCRMHSLLKVGDGTKVDVHHRSFLDFLNEPTRSQDYHISYKASAKRYLERIIDVVARHASKLLEQTDNPASHEHFQPNFFVLLPRFPMFFDIISDHLEQVPHPLFKVKDESLRHQGFCDKCNTICIIDDLLLYAALQRQFPRPTASSHITKKEQKFIKSSRKLKSILESLDGRVAWLARKLRPIKASKGVADVDSSLSSFLHTIRDRKVFNSVTTIDVFCALLRLDHNLIASKIRSTHDAQNLIDFIHYVKSDKIFLDLCGPDAVHKSLQLTILVYGRVPVIPQFHMDGMIVSDSGRITEDNGRCVAHYVFGGLQHALIDACQAAVIWKTLSHKTLPILLYVYRDGLNLLFAYHEPENGSLQAWRAHSGPSITEILNKVAEFIQFIHSLSLVLVEPITGDIIGLDSNFQVKVPALCRSLHLQPKCHRSVPSSGYETDIFNFGLLFYEIYYDKPISNNEYMFENRDTVMNRPDGPLIDENAWQLIQRCCAEDEKERPTIDKVVEELKSWR